VNDTLSAVEKAARPFDRCAQVLAADHLTRYTRTGTGNPVLLLDIGACSADTAGEDGARWPELLERIAMSHRLIVPEIPIATPRFASWLRGFIDGLGLAPIRLVAAGAVCVSALEFVLSDPDRVERLLLVPAGSSEEPGLAGVVHPADTSADVPILVVRRDHPRDEAAEAIMRFLASEKA
jgi:pimeloyl-ACP methyl ester carboxylesterase